MIASPPPRRRPAGAGGASTRLVVSVVASSLVLLLGSVAPAAATADAAAAAASSSSGRSSSSSLSSGSNGNANDSTTDGGLHFLALGDWGGSELWPYTTRAQVSTANGMASVASSHNSQFVLALGDNFYSHGVSGTASGKSARRRFDKTFESVYGQESLDVPWYVTAGNHDHYGNVSAQLEFQKVDERWVFPDLFHAVRKEFTIGADAGGPSDNGGDDDGPETTSSSSTTMSLDIVLIDTVVLAGMHFIVDHDDPGYFDPPPGPLDSSLASRYLTWIERQLADSTADYLLVAGHYPVYSACRHGSTPYLIEHLEPLLLKYNVTAYLSGHEHCQLHIRRGEMDYLLTGTGDECCYDATNIDALPEDAELKYLLAADRNKAKVKGGFASFDVAGRNEMTVKLHNENGKVLYEAELRPRSKLTDRGSGADIGVAEVGAAVSTY